MWTILYCNEVASADITAALKAEATWKFGFDQIQFVEYLPLLFQVGKKVRTLYILYNYTIKE
jgi:hypothetical protein